MIHVDITELASNPLRTGIQRVVRELLKNWRAATPLAPCVYDRSRNALVQLPMEALAVLRDERDDLRSASPAQLADEIQRIRAQGPVKRIDPQPGRLLVPELFYDAARCHFYRRKLATDPSFAHFLIYDFIPWLEPSSVGVEDASPLMHYLNLTQMAASTAFISERTRDDWARRILRRPQATGPVVPLGADGLGLEKQHWRADRRVFTCVGSLDGRRNQHLIVRAFRKLWVRGFDMRLAIYGHAFDVTHVVASEVIAAARLEPMLDHFGDATDRDVMDGLRRSRATIYLSTVEGYGLPPVESLHAGIPVITTDIPSISNLPERGHVRLRSTGVDELEAAILRLADDRAAEQIWQEAASMQLSTWRDFAAAMEDWVRA
jgi:glycosyltransferase involved in cell wall biosynthesis